MFLPSGSEVAIGCEPCFCVVGLGRRGFRLWRTGWNRWGVIICPHSQSFNVDSATECQCLDFSDEILEIRLVIGWLGFSALGALGFEDIFLGPWSAAFARFTLQLVMVLPVGASATVGKGPFILTAL